MIRDTRIGGQEISPRRRDPDPGLAWRRRALIERPLGVLDRVLLGHDLAWRKPTLGDEAHGGFEVVRVVVRKRAAYDQLASNDGLGRELERTSVQPEHE